MTFPARILLIFFLAWQTPSLPFVKSTTLPFTAGLEAYKEVQGVNGEKVALPCNTSYWGDETISLVLWYKGFSDVPIYTLDVRDWPLAKSRHISSAQLKDRAYFDVSLNPPLLIMENLTKNDEGAFRCRVDYREARSENFFLNLTITVPPRETVIMDAEGQRLEGVIGPYEEGANLLLICEAEGGDPPPTVKWWRGGELVDESFTVGAHGFVRNELQLSDLSRSDLLTVLTCQSSNTELVAPSEISVSLDLTLRPLEVTITSPKRSVSANTLTELTCRSSGSRPPAQMTWWIGGAQVKTMAVRQSVSLDTNLTTSSLSLVGSLGDNGKELSCRAENTAMKDKPLEEKMTLNVHYVPQVRISLGAKIDESSIREGTDVYFECTVDANPWVTEVSWLLDGKLLFSDPSSGIIISNQSLVLQKVKQQSRGRYWCLASNAEGQGRSEDFYLKVLFAPVCRAEQKVTYGVARNELVKVSCEVDADPANVSFKWHLNDLDIRTEIRTFVANKTKSVATYVPSSIRTYGKMICWAENTIGRQREPCVFNIIPASPPEAVHNCSVRNQSFNSLLVACEPGDNGGLRQVFFLEVYNSEAQRLHSNITAVDAPLFRVQQLPPGAKFTLNVYAVNTIGRSPSLLLDVPTLLPQKQTHKVHATSEEAMVTPIVAIFIGLVSIVSLLSILLVVCLKLKSRQGRRQANHDTPSETKKTQSASHQSFDSFHGGNPDSQLNCSGDAVGGYFLKPTGSILTGPHYHHQGNFNELRPVTYAELSLAPCETLLGPCHKQEHMSMNEYAQLDFERSKFRALVLDDDVSLRRSPAADGCSDIGMTVEGPYLENLHPANYHSHDIIIRRLSPQHHRTASPV